MNPIDDNYTPSESRPPDGMYTVNGFKWSTIDQATGNPVLVKPQNSDRLVARLKLHCVNSEMTLTMQIELKGMVLLPLAFGVQQSFLSQAIPQIPHEGDAVNVSAYMRFIETICNEAAVSRVVESKSGWVNWIPGMDSFRGNFQFSVFDVWPKNKETGSAELASGNYGPYFRVTFEIIGDETGKPTIFTGVRFMETLSYAVTVLDGRPDWSRTESGEFTSAAMAMSRLFKFSAPGFFDPPFNPPNPYNLVESWYPRVKATKVVLSGTRGLPASSRKQKIGLLWETLQTPGYTPKAPNYTGPTFTLQQPQGQNLTALEVPHQAAAYQQGINPADSVTPVQFTMQQFTTQPATFEVQPPVSTTAQPEVVKAPTVAPVSIQPSVQQPVQQVNPQFANMTPPSFVGAQQSNPDEVDKGARSLLVELIGTLGNIPKEAVLTDPNEYVLSDEAKKVAGMYFSILRTNGTLPHTMIKQMDYGMVEKIFTYIRTIPLGSDLTEKITMLCKTFESMKIAVTPSNTDSF